MSSPELSNEEFDFDSFSTQSSEEEESPSLINKKARLVAASRKNDVVTLKQLLDDPKLYKVRDKDGLNLLHIAIFQESDEVFDYLLSLNDFPLEAVDKNNATALVMALFYFDEHYSRVEKCDRYAFELIKKGADIDEIDFEEDPLLHFALERGFVRVARLLIERGADVNIISEGDSPFHKWFNCYKNYFMSHEIMLTESIESLTMLLCNGPAICDDPNFFDCTILDTVLKLEGSDDVLVAQETLFSFAFDEWSLYKIPCATLFRLAHDKSPLFHWVIKFTSEVIFEYDHDPECYCLGLFTIDSEYLWVLLEKYPYFVKELLQSYSEDYLYPRFSTFDLKNLDMLIQSSLCSDAIELVSNLNTNRLIQSILYSGKDIEEAMEVIYYLLSYGMSLKEKDLENIYKKTGYSEDFKNLLFMDVQKQIGGTITEVMPRLIYDVTLDIHKIVEDPYFLLYQSFQPLGYWDQIFHYFIHPKIQDAYHQLELNEAIGRQLPRIPLLQELARDKFRKYFIKIFKITSAKEFYTLIKMLPISSVHKKIITFESKLY